LSAEDPRTTKSVSPPGAVGRAVAQWMALDDRRRSSEGLVLWLGGTAVWVALTRIAAGWTPLSLVPVAAGSVMGLVGLGWFVWAGVRSRRRDLDQTARAVDQAGHTRELLRTALSIEAGSASGDAGLAEDTLHQATSKLSTLAPLADRPVRVPPAGIAGLVVGAALAFVPMPPVESIPAASTPGTAPRSATAPAASARVDAPAGTVDEAQPGGQTTADATPSGSGDRTSQGGARSGQSDGTTGSQGQSAASGEAVGAEADGAASAGVGSSGGEARDAGTSGTEEQGAISAGGPSGPREEADAADAEADAPVASEDGRSMSSPVGQTAAETDAVRSDQATLGMSGDTPDDQDAQTRDVAGTLGMPLDGPQFFDAEEEADGEQDGKGGAGGWTVGLSQPGRGGVNDASGSTWRTEAGLDDPPDWTDAPTEWVDAAWQDSPAGVIRRVRGGEAGGAGSAAYQEAWHRYAAVAEADAAADEVPAGRRDLVRAYFLAIAPPETP